MTFNTPNSIYTNIEYVGDTTKREPMLYQLANYWNINFGKFGAPMFSAYCLSLAAYHVITIILMAACYKMRWIAAPFVITDMANNRSVRNGSVGKFINKSMRHVVLIVDRKTTIAVGLYRRPPLPTASRCQDVFVNKPPYVIDGVFNHTYLYGNHTYSRQGLN